MKWFTICGYDGNYDVVYHIKAEILEEAIGIAFELGMSGSPGFAFESKLDNLIPDVKYMVEE